MRRDIFESIGIVLGTIFIALVTNSFRSDGLSLVRAEMSSQQLSSEAEIGEGSISFRTFVNKLHQPGMIILDARASEEFRGGRMFREQKAYHMMSSRKSRRWFSKILLLTERLSPTARK